jgi:hypothetical protein
MVPTFSMIFDSFQGESAMEAFIGSGYQGSWARKRAIGPHIISAKIWCSKTGKFYSESLDLTEKKTGTWYIVILIFSRRKRPQ